MDKRTKKKNNYNAEILIRLIEKYGVSKRFITMSLNGDRNSETSDTIKSDYKEMVKQVAETLKKL
jgi:acetate kinase